jgi:hypothetical protein
MSPGPARRPGSRPDCPPWCETDHGGLRDPLHSRTCATFELAAGTVSVVLAWNPRDHLAAYRQPRIAVIGVLPDRAIERMGADFVWLVSGDSEQFAGLMDLLGHGELARAICGAAELLGQAQRPAGGPDA